MEQVKLGDGTTVAVGAIVYRRESKFNGDAWAGPMKLVTIWPGMADPMVQLLGADGNLRTINPYQLRKVCPFEEVVCDARLIAALRIARPTQLAKPASQPTNGRHSSIFWSLPVLRSLRSLWRG